MVSIGEGRRCDGHRWATGVMGAGGQLGYLVLIELSSPFVSGTPSEDLTTIDAKELTNMLCWSW